MSNPVLVADVGGTGSKWILVNGNSGRVIECAGFNPYVSPIQELNRIITEELLPNLGLRPSSVEYFGAGCARSEFRDRVMDALSQHFRAVTVRSDLEGAGLALFGSGTGTAVILGTGMNAGYFETGILVQGVPSLGYLLGDEGSGMDIGRHFLSAYFKKKLPTSIANALETHLQLDEDEILKMIYESEKPNTTMASLLPFIAENNTDETVRILITERIEHMFDLLQEQLGERAKKVGIVGSVGYFLRDLIKTSANRKGIAIHKVIQDPISGLMDHFSSEGS